MAARRGAEMGETSSCTTESLYKVSHRRSQGMRYEKSKLACRAPGFCRRLKPGAVPLVTLNKLWKKVENVSGVTPWPANTAVRENPNSRLGVGFRLIFCPWKNGWGGKWWPARRPKKESKRIGPR
jgi:hypothetical protein